MRRAEQSVARQALDEAAALRLGVVRKFRRVGGSADDRRHGSQKGYYRLVPARELGSVAIEN